MGQSTDEVSPGWKDLFRRVYQVTYSKTIGLIIILVLAVFVLIGVVVAQAPAGVWGDPEQRVQFVSQMRWKYGGWAEVFSVLGFFHVFTSVGFLVVIVALAISIAGCTIHRIPQLWARWRHPRATVSPRFFTTARYLGSIRTPMAPDEAVAIAADKLKSSHYRVIGPDERTLYADKYSWGEFGTVVAHLSFILILAAFFITGLAGYEAILNVSVAGGPTPVGHGTQISVEATDFDASYSADGRPLDYVSHIIIRDAGQIVAEQDIRVNEPIIYGNWAFHQDSFGFAVDVEVRDVSNTVIFAGAVPQQWTSSDGLYSIGRFRLDDLGVTVDVLSPASGVTASGLAPGQVAFLIYADGQANATTMQVVDQGSSVGIGDLDFTYQRESQFTGIKARTDPGGVWMWIGSILLVVGMTITFSCRHRRVWVRAEDGGVMFASADKEDSGLRQSFEDLVARAESWYPSSGLSADPATQPSPDDTPEEENHVQAELDAGL